jgi:hypothetical protein
LKIGSSSAPKCNIQNGYSLSTNIETSCSIDPETIFETGIDFENITSILYPDDYLNLLFLKPSNMLLSRFPFSCGIIFDGPGQVNLVIPENELQKIISSIIIKTQVKNILTDSSLPNITIQGDFEVIFPGYINSFSRLFGQPYLISTLDQFISGWSQYTNIQLYGYSLIGIPELLTFDAYSLKFDNEETSNFIFPSSIRVLKFISSVVRKKIFIDGQISDQPHLIKFFLTATSKDSDSILFVETDLQLFSDFRLYFDVPSELGMVVEKISDDFPLTTSGGCQLYPGGSNASLYLTSQIDGCSDPDWNQPKHYCFYSQSIFFLLFIQFLKLSLMEIMKFLLKFQTYFTTFQLMEQIQIPH